MRATRIILKGLRVHGWSYDQLLKCQGVLITKIFKYMNREQLSHGQIRCRSQAPRKRRHVEDNNIEYRKPRVINIDIEESSHNSNFIAMTERETLETNIAPMPSRAKAIEHRSHRQDFNEPSNRLETTQVSHWNEAYAITLNNQE